MLSGMIFTGEPGLGLLILYSPSSLFAKKVAPLSGFFTVLQEGNPISSGFEHHEFLPERPWAAFFVASFPSCPEALGLLRGEQWPTSAKRASAFNPACPVHKPGCCTQTYFVHRGLPGCTKTP
jgi:hypothetical protein